MTTDELQRSAARAHVAGRHENAIRELRAAFDADPNFLALEAARHVASIPVADRRQFWRAPPELFSNTADVRAVFDTIYARAIWGGGSGGGSDVQVAVPYMAYVQHLLGRFAIRSIVDLGCGDWRFSKHLDLSSREYLGVDIVASVIAANTKAYGSDHVRFEVADAITFDIPDCDLLVCKDVLQHLSNANVRAILDRSRAARFALFTNDYHPANEDCPNGSTRPLDITRPPFLASAQPRLTFAGKVTFLMVRGSRARA
jgi:SAM-dependent methyltransferase